MEQFSEGTVVLVGYLSEDPEVGVVVRASNGFVTVLLENGYYTVSDPDSVPIRKFEGESKWANDLCTLLGFKDN